MARVVSVASGAGSHRDGRGECAACGERTAEVESSCGERTGAGSEAESTCRGATPGRECPAAHGEADSACRHYAAGRGPAAHGQADRARGDDATAGREADAASRVERAVDEPSA